MSWRAHLVKTQLTLLNPRAGRHCSPSGAATCCSKILRVSTSYDFTAHAQVLTTTYRAINHLQTALACSLCTGSSVYTQAGWVGIGTWLMHRAAYASRGGKFAGARGFCTNSNDNIRGILLQEAGLRCKGCSFALMDMLFTRTECAHFARVCFRAADSRSCSAARLLRCSSRLACQRA